MKFIIIEFSASERLFIKKPQYYVIVDMPLYCTLKAFKSSRFKTQISHFKSLIIATIEPRYNKKPAIAKIFCSPCHSQIVHSIPL